MDMTVYILPVRSARRFVNLVRPNDVERVSAIVLSENRKATLCRGMFGFSTALKGQLLLIFLESPAFL